MNKEEAIKLVKKKWNREGQCSSCGWHGVLSSDYDLEEQVRINREKNRIELPCASGESGHRGVRIYFSEEETFSLRLGSKAKGWELKSNHISKHQLLDNLLGKKESEFIWRGEQADYLIVTDEENGHVHKFDPVVFIDMDEEVFKYIITNLF